MISIICLIKVSLEETIKGRKVQIAKVLRMKSLAFDFSDDSYATSRLNRGLLKLNRLP